MANFHTYNADAIQLNSTAQPRRGLRTAVWRHNANDVTATHSTFELS